MIGPSFLKPKARHAYLLFFGKIKKDMSTSSSKYIHMHVILEDKMVHIVIENAKTTSKETICTYKASNTTNNNIVNRRRTS